MCKLGTHREDCLPSLEALTSGVVSDTTGGDRICAEESDRTGARTCRSNGLLVACTREFDSGGTCGEFDDVIDISWTTSAAGTDTGAISQLG